jgi:hypothetical protein
MRRILRTIAAVVVAVAATGCSGLEIGGKAWIASIDEKSESSRTYRSNVPLKCYFVDCGANQTSDELPAK